MRRVGRGNVAAGHVRPSPTHPSLSVSLFTCPSINPLAPPNLNHPRIHTPTHRLGTCDALMVATLQLGNFKPLPVPLIHRSTLFLPNFHPRATHRAEYMRRVDRGNVTAGELDVAVWHA